MLRSGSGARTDRRSEAGGATQGSNRLMSCGSRSAGSPSRRRISGCPRCLKEAVKPEASLTLSCPMLCTVNDSI
jgi:hypothetical protein